MSATGRAYSTLRDDILSWRLAPGFALSEIELSERLGVSRTPLRTALERLALEGLVDATRRTAVVSEVSPATIGELFEVRRALELEAARLAARRRDPAVFDELTSRFSDAQRLLADDDVESYYALVADFDDAVDAAVANPSMTAALAGIRTHLVRARRVAAANTARLLRAAQEHKLICEAIRDGDDGLAASAAAVHLHASLANILATLESQPLDSQPLDSHPLEEGTT